MNKEARKAWWRKAIKKSLLDLRKQIAEAAYSTGLTTEEIEQLMQTYAELNYLLLNGEFLEDE